MSLSPLYDYSRRLARIKVPLAVEAMPILLSLTVCHVAVTHSVPFNNTRALKSSHPLWGTPKMPLFTHPTQCQLESPYLIGVVRRHTFMIRSLFSSSPMITRTSSIFVKASGVLPSSKSHPDPQLFFNFSLTWDWHFCPPPVSVLNPTSGAQWYLQASGSLVVIVCDHLVHSLGNQPNLGKFSAMAHSNIQ